MVHTQPSVARWYVRAVIPEPDKRIPFFAFGNVAVGVIAVGNVAVGVVAIGFSLAIGPIAIGLNSVGLPLAAGLNAIGIVSLAAINGLGVLTAAGVNGGGVFAHAGVNPGQGAAFGVFFGVLALIGALLARAPAEVGLTGRLLSVDGERLRVWSGLRAPTLPWDQEAGAQPIEDATGLVGRRVRVAVRDVEQVHDLGAYREAPKIDRRVVVTACTEVGYTRAWLARVARVCLFLSSAIALVTTLASLR